MQEINININNAKIQSYTVYLSEDKPQVEVCIGLYTDDKQITTFNASTRSYSSTKFPMNTRLIKNMLTMAKELEYAVVKEQNKDLIQIGCE